MDALYRHKALPVVKEAVDDGLEEERGIYGA
jgi:hypothetical protein